MLFAALQLDDHEPLRARRRREDGGWRLVSTRVLKESCAATTPATSELWRMDTRPWLEAVGVHGTSL